MLTQSNHCSRIEIEWFLRLPHESYLNLVLRKPQLPYLINLIWDYHAAICKSGLTNLRSIILKGTRRFLSKFSNCLHIHSYLDIHDYVIETTRKQLPDYKLFKKCLFRFLSNTKPLRWDKKKPTDYEVLVLILMQNEN